VQICSHLSPDESKRLPNLLPTTRRVQVIHVENEDALNMIAQYAPYVHAFLLDSGHPLLPTLVYGGTGRTHDWSVSADFVRRSPHPVFLAGGLSPGNVGEAIRTVRPFGVDLCSGVRTDGRLDRAKLGAFVDAVRGANAACSQKIQGSSSRILREADNEVYVAQLALTPLRNASSRNVCFRCGGRLSTPPSA